MNVKRVKKPGLLVLALGLVFAAACDTAPIQTPTAVPTTVPPTPTQAATSVPPTPTAESLLILPTPAAILSLDDQLIKTFEISDPDEIVALNSSVWVKTDGGRLVQIDPSKNEIVGELQLDPAPDPYRRCQGLGADDTSIWACSATEETFDVVRVDPATRTVVATVKVAKVLDQLRMPYLAKRIWVVSGNADQLVGIDVTTNQPGSPIDLGAQCLHVAATADALVATCERTNQVLKVDPASGKITAQTTLEGPGAVAASADSVWVGTKTGLARLRAGDLSLAAMFGVPSPSTGDLYATEEAVWVRLAGRFLYEIDPRSNTVARQITADPSLSGGSVAVTADSIWATTYDHHMIYRLKR
jgi:hypothetical protein